MSYDENRIEDLKKKLYSPSSKIGKDIRRPLSENKENVSSTWNDDTSLRTKEDQEEIDEAFKEKKNGKFGVLISLLILSFIFFAGALAYAYFAINNNKSVISNKNIDLSIVSPIAVGGGEALPLEITITNKNAGPLDGVDLIVEFPKGTKQAGDVTQNGERYIKTIGSIGPGEVVRETVEAIVFGEEDENAHIEVSLQYNAESSSAIFTKSESIDVALSAPPIIASLESLSEVTSGQNLSFKVTLESNSSQILKNIILVANYPFGFSLVDSSEKPFYNNRVWNIGELKPREKKEITIDGVMQGQDNEERYFDFSVGIQDDEVKEEISVLLGQVGRDISIARPFIALKTIFDREEASSVVRDAGTISSGEVLVTNTTPNTIQNIQIDLKIQGDLLDKFNVSARDGFYNSNTNTITWNSQTNGKLESLSPGEEERLLYNFKIKPLLGSNDFSLNPEILFSINASGNRPAESGVSDELETTSLAKVAVASAFTVAGGSRYSTGPIKNTGPVPPKVGVATTYTITWDLTNTVNAMEDARMTAKLPQYVNWQGKTYPSEEDIKYNPTTREVIWTVGDLDTRVGYSKPKRSASFQVELTPSTSQFEQEVVLVEPSTFIGYDNFAEANREKTLEVITTDTVDSTDYRNGRVIQ